MKRAVLLLFFVASCSLDYTKLRGPSDGAGGASTDGTGGRGAMGGGGSTAVDAFGEGPETSGSGGTPADSAQVDGSGNPDTGDAGPPNCVSNASCNCEFFGAHAYRFCKTNRQFADAEADCVAEGMRLVRLDSNAENNWVFQTKQAEGLPTTWIGATDIVTEGDWRWIDGTPFWSGLGVAKGGVPVGSLYNDWDIPGDQPDNTGNEDCAGYWYQIPTWSDLTCTDANAYVCESY